MNEDSRGPQFIFRGGQPEWAVIPYPIFENFIHDLEEKSRDSAKKALDGIRNQASFDGLCELNTEQVDEIVQRVSVRGKW
jgi:hypothetical protein